jgi:hypothetical protein
VDRIRIALELLRDVIPESIKIDLNNFSHKLYFTRPTIRSLGPGSLIRFTSVNPAAFIHDVYSTSL